MQILQSVYNQFQDLFALLIEEFYSYYTHIYERTKLQHYTDLKDRRKLVLRTLRF